MRSSSVTLTLSEGSTASNEIVRIGEGSCIMGL
jgi:hypothetical protein